MKAESFVIRCRWPRRQEFTSVNRNNRIFLLWLFFSLETIRQFSTPPANWLLRHWFFLRNCDSALVRWTGLRSKTFYLDDTPMAQIWVSRILRWRHTLSLLRHRGDGPLHALPQQQHVTLQFGVNEPTAANPSFHIHRRTNKDAIDPKGQSPPTTRSGPAQNEDHHLLHYTYILYI